MSNSTDPPLRPAFPGWCSFCHKSYTDVGPLAEGPELVYICGSCATKCWNLIEEERATAQQSAKADELRFGSARLLRGVGAVRGEILYGVRTTAGSTHEVSIMLKGLQSLSALPGAAPLRAFDTLERAVQCQLAMADSMLGEAKLAVTIRDVRIDPPVYDEGFLSLLSINCTGQMIEKWTAR